VHVFVDFHHRPQAAAADAAHRFQGKALVFCGFAVAEMPRVSSIFREPFSARTWQAVPRQMDDDVASPGFQAEGAVKGGHTVNLAVGDADFNGR
jgi:hypothetical protein